MRRYVLQRGRSTDQGTPGQLLRADGTRVAFSLELPWRDNARSRSCIPAGRYLCRQRRSPRFGEVYAIEGVAGRSNVLIHAGNVAGDTSKGFASDVLGCVLLGQQLGTLRGQLALLVSRPAVSALQREAGGEPFTLEVRSWTSRD